jgi:hypothetical protein
MNPDLALLIAQLSLTLLPGSQPATAVAQTLVKIIQSARQAYEQHTGQPLDPSLIQREETI